MVASLALQGTSTLTEWSNQQFIRVDSIDFYYIYIIIIMIALHTKIVHNTKQTEVHDTHKSYNVT